MDTAATVGKTIQKSTENIGDTLYDAAVDAINATEYAAEVVVGATQDAALDARDLVLVRPATLSPYPVSGSVPSPLRQSVLPEVLCLVLGLILTWKSGALLNSISVYLHRSVCRQQDVADYLGINYGPLKQKRRAQRNWKKAKALAIFAVQAARRRRQAAPPAPAVPSRSATVSSVPSRRSEPESTQSSVDYLNRHGADFLSPRCAGLAAPPSIAPPPRCPASEASPQSVCPLCAAGSERWWESWTVRVPAGCGFVFKEVAQRRFPLQQTLAPLTNAPHRRPCLCRQQARVSRSATSRGSTRGLRSRRPPLRSWRRTRTLPAAAASPLGDDEHRRSRN